jgi:hypothetical protein
VRYPAKPTPGGADNLTMVGRLSLPLVLFFVLGTSMACGDEEAAPAPEPEDSSLHIGLPVDETPTNGESQAPGDGDGDGEPGDGDGDGDGDPVVEPDPDPETPDPDPIPAPDGQCNVWQDCGPLYDDPNSGMECVSNTCQCDPVGQWAGTCGSMGGFWVQSACQCVFSDMPPPSYEPTEDCWWHLEQPPCDPDRWVDTSHYEDECYYDAYDQYVCDPVWVESGYYEAGACPSPYWLERCYG